MSNAEMPVLVEGAALASANSGDIFVSQQLLRARLLDNKGIRYAPARDLAAHMLLRLDDLKGCWSIATDWLRIELGCHRVDTGFGLRHRKDYFPGFAEAKHADFDVPSFGCGVAVDNRDSAMQAMWTIAHPLVFADIKRDRRISRRLQQRLTGSRTKSKFAWALRNGNVSYGLLCADWTEHFVPWESGLYDCFEQTVADVLGPIIDHAKEFSGRLASDMNLDTEINGRGVSLSGDPAANVLASLTSSEIEVAKLVAKGLSYKQIARIRDRSFSTIDHQLRSIRRKTGATSTSALISLISRLEQVHR